MSSIKNSMKINKNNWETPEKIFKPLNEEFHFTLDPCATEKNSKCKKYFTLKENGLVQSWKDEVVFCNPPCGRETGKWVKKCYEEWKNNGTKIVMLIPARTDTKYFHDYIYNYAEIRFIKGRIKFEINGDNFGNCSPFPSMIVVFK